MTLYIPMYTLALHMHAHALMYEEQLVEHMHKFVSKHALNTKSTRAMTIVATYLPVLNYMHVVYNGVS